MHHYVGSCRHLSFLQHRIICFSHCYQLVPYIVILVATAFFIWSTKLSSPGMTQRAKAQSISIITFQNDYKLLSDWVAWHGSIGGLNNLYVINHVEEGSSRSVRTESFLSCCESRGLNVRHFAGDFRRKAEVVTELILEIIDDYSFVIPLDVDEFLVLELQEPEGPLTLFPSSKIGGNDLSIDWVNKTKASKEFVADPALILDHLFSLPRDGKKYKMGYHESSCPTGTAIHRLTLNNFITAPPTKSMHNGHGTKTFFMGGKGNKFIGMDTGNHVGYVHTDGNATIQEQNNSPYRFYHVTRLGIVHFASYAYKHWERKMRRRSSSYGYTTELCKEYLSKNMAIIGQHYCEALIAIDEGKSFQNYESICKELSQRSKFQSSLSKYIQSTPNLPCHDCMKQRI